MTAKMFEILLRPAILAPAVMLVAYLVYQIFIKPSGLPDLPILNAKEGDWFPLWQATWRNTRDFKAATLLAYEKYRDQACIVPLAGSGNMILLPASQTQFVIDQPYSVLSMHDKTIETLQTDYTIMEPSLIRNPLHNKIIVTTLTSQIGNLAPALAEETAWGLKHYWGTDTKEYREVCVYGTMRRIIGIVTNRIFVSLPTSRDPALLDAGMAYAQDVPVSSELLRLFPKPIRPLLSLAIMIPNRIHTNAFVKILRPLIEQRLKKYDERQADPDKKALKPEPNDFLQWSIKQAKESGNPSLWDPKTLAGRVLLLNFASIHTSSFAITGAILDLVSSKKEYIDELREEISSVLAEHGGQWNKRALAKMEKLDSAMRESQRVNSFVTVGLGRLVVAEKGLTTPDGVHIRKGLVTYVPGYAVHQDPKIYPEPEKYKPFRFSEKRADENTEYVKRARQQWATTSNDYLAFGHGKDACPGRFFAAAELKLMLAHLVMHYDFEMQETRPRNTWFALNRVPPMKATVRIRRREKVLRLMFPA
ncbi:cytochrome P450 [Ilyonectria destructans]|nr:cytochrome P450 [Ilyonectria destructans]